jgi:soluble lytic murein transglycosylase
MTCRQRLLQLLLGQPFLHYLSMKNTKFKKIFPLVFLSLVSFASFAATALTLQDQRELYLRARQALQQDKKPYFFSLAKQLKNYPLYPYLVYAELLPRLPSLPENEVANFLKQYQDTLIATRLRSQWLQVLAQQKQWPLFFTYSAPSIDPNIVCLTWQAKIATGKANQIWSELSAVWLTGQKLPDSCGPVFSLAQQQGKLTSDLIWQRLQLAFDAKNFSLIPYLAALLPQDQRGWVDVWRRANEEPNLVMRPPLVNNDNMYSNRIIVDALQDLAKDDSAKAINAWQSLSQSHHFTSDQQQQVTRAIALDLAAEHAPGASRWLDQVNSKTADKKVREWRIRTAIFNGDWKAVLAKIDDLPQDEKNTPIWRYWSARANEVLGKATLAQVEYAKLAQERHYYALMASLHLRKPYRVQGSTAALNEKAMMQVFKKPGIQRAYELYALDMPGLANAEWQFALQKMDPEELYYAAKLAQQWGWTNQALFTASKAAHQDDLSLRFPLLHSQSILAAARQRQMDPAWSYAVIRQESAFAPKAQSGAGALGLMQLLPTTAKSLAARGQKITPKTLTEPTTNIQLGTAYLNKILQAYKGNVFLATAAYNVGFGRLRTYIPSQPMPADIWVDTLPWHETRDYVKNVIAYMVIYQQRLGQSVIKFTAPPTVP